MFDVGFSEIIMVALVALLVIGPEKLPKVARLAGYWLGKARQTVATVKSEIRQELHAEEMRQLLNHEHAEQELRQALSDTETAIKTIKMDVETVSSASKTARKDEQSS
ncbi:MAG: Sec-independent protein translocase protein TatB [Methylomonas sp.]|jgi:sec-independent protein translocase protein TatB